MLTLPQSMQRLIREFSKLPSLGEKSATRLAYYLVNNHREQAEALARALHDAVVNVKLCERCFYLCEESLCSICRSTNRDSSLVCVVEKPADLIAIERVGEYRGLYHVLHGLWAPLRGQGPETMKLQELLARLGEGVIKEVIIATGSTVEGDATALYVAKLVADFGVQSTRLAQGMPKGGELEYADEVTLSRAFMGRTTIGG
jgi:recombination protein RecR